MCYYTNWSGYRKGDGKFVPENLDPTLCTHIVYAYSTLEPNDLIIKSFDPMADIDNGEFYLKLIGKYMKIDISNIGPSHVGNS